MKKSMKTIVLFIFASICSTMQAQTVTWQNIRQLQNDSVDRALSGSIGTDSKGNIWLIGSRGVFKITPAGSCKIYNSTNSPYLNGIGLCVDAQDRIWIGNGSSLLEFDGDSVWKVYNNANSGHPGEQIIDMKLDGKGNVWCVFSFKGIGKFTNGQFTLYNQSNSQIPTDGTLRIAIDRSDNVWISTLAGGLIKYDQQKFTFFSKLSNGQSIPALIALHADKNSHVWGGMYASGIFHFDGTSFVIEQPSGLAPTIGKILEDRIGKVWFVSSNSYLISYNGSSWNTNVGNASTQAAWFVGAAFDKDAALWVTSNDKGLFKLSFTDTDTGTITSVPSFDRAEDQKASAVLYPNPSVSSTRMTYQGFEKQVTIHVYDLQGRLLTTIHDLPEAGSTHLTIGQRGVFFVHIASENHSVIQKLILL
jgi:ligand-binding sensor domain-containing protein